MLGWTLVFAVLALIAGFFGFMGLAGFAASVAKLLFFIFLILLVISFIMRAIRGNSVSSQIKVRRVGNIRRPTSLPICGGGDAPPT
jgi:uncharacterized membrane protein YtjA (UPF0391 family)